MARVASTVHQVEVKAAKKPAPQTDIVLATLVKPSPTRVDATSDMPSKFAKQLLTMDKSDWALLSQYRREYARASKARDTRTTKYLEQCMRELLPGGTRVVQAPRPSMSTR